MRFAAPLLVGASVLSQCVQLVLHKVQSEVPKPIPKYFIFYLSSSQVGKRNLMINKFQGVQSSWSFHPTHETVSWYGEGVVFQYQENEAMPAGTQHVLQGGTIPGNNVRFVGLILTT